MEWRAEDLSKPTFTGRREVEVPIAELIDYIDWTWFFSAWELRGRYPAILDDPKVGAAARELHEHGREMLDRIVRDGSLTARGVYGFWGAHSEGDDLVLFDDETRASELVRFSMLRQQGVLGESKPNRSLADYVAPAESGLQDWIGAFAVTAGIGADELAASFEADHDDYNAILVKALADRLAEAFAEWLHARARRDWSYGANENLANTDLIAERYRGIRPAFGYPACPDHSPKTRLFELLGAEALGITLSESMAMLPAASVSGLYFSHPEARYFNVGRLGRDQIEDYAKRTGRKRSVVERWLSPNLAYDPDQA